MPKLPAISGKKLLRVLGRIGFALVRQAGSHAFVQHSDGRTATIPLHGNADLPTGTLRGILGDIDISLNELRKLL